VTQVPRVDSPTRLAKINAGAATKATPASPSVPSRISKTLAGGRRGRDVELAELGPAYCELPGAMRWTAIEAEVRKKMAALELEVGVDTATNLEALLAMHVLADAMRERDDHKVPIGTVEDWGNVDNDVLNFAWRAYEEVRAELDPVAVAMTADDMHAIAAAVKKKDPALLRTFGSMRLALFLASMEDPPPTSPIPSSPNTESPPES
jgi:hypothetical protein